MLKLLLKPAVAEAMREDVHVAQHSESRGDTGKKSKEILTAIAVLSATSLDVWQHRTFLTQTDSHLTPQLWIDSSAAEPLIGKACQSRL